MLGQPAVTSTAWRRGVEGVRIGQTIVLCAAPEMSFAVVVCVSRDRLFALEAALR